MKLHHRCMKNVFVCSGADVEKVIDVKMLAVWVHLPVTLLKDSWIYSNFLYKQIRISLGADMLAACDELQLSVYFIFILLTCKNFKCFMYLLFVSMSVCVLWGLCECTYVFLCMSLQRPQQDTGTLLSLSVFGPLNWSLPFLARLAERAEGS